MQIILKETQWLYIFYKSEKCSEGAAHPIKKKKKQTLL